MTDEQRFDCPDCAEGLSRREFVRKVAGAAAAGAFLPLVGSARQVSAAATPKSTDETSVKRLYDSLSEAQRKELCFPFDHALRKRISANWDITKPEIEDFTSEQQIIVEEIFKSVVSPDGYERFKKQMDDDAGGFGKYHVAIFGTPGSGAFEWEMTGRHMTIRADGNSVAGSAFGGPIIYGHGAGDSEKGLPGNVFYYQTQKANEVFKALDGKQREKALLPKAPKEDAVKIQGEGAKFPGIRVGDLSKDQKDLVESVIKVLLAPYREEDVNEAIALRKEGGGLDALHMSFYQNEDVGMDHEWDVWRLEGPTWVWHFRGAPHVHAYINISKKA